MNKTFYILFVMMTALIPLPFFGNGISSNPVLAYNDFERSRMNTVEEVPTATNNESSDHWKLPNILTQVSGIKYLGNNRFACIQDEVGTIYIYNTETESIEKEIPFSGPGDFEGIAIAGTAAYAVQSDGKIYEVLNYEGANPVVNQYKTSLTAKHNVEGLTYDKKNNRLLLAIKGSEPRNNKSKGIYAFDLKSKRLAPSQAVKINLNDPFFTSLQSGDKRLAFQPSAIEIHPVTNDIYILQGTDPKLLVMDAKGHIKRLYTLNKSEFPQAEGLAFTPNGELFISNEGKDGAASIVKVTL